MVGIFLGTHIIIQNEIICLIDEIWVLIILSCFVLLAGWSQLTHQISLVLTSFMTDCFLYLIHIYSGKILKELSVF